MNTDTGELYAAKIKIAEALARGEKVIEISAEEHDELEQLRAEVRMARLEQLRKESAARNESIAGRPGGSKASLRRRRKAERKRLDRGPW